MIKKIIYCLFSIIFFTSCGNEEKQEFDLLIINASIIEVETGITQPSKIIGINGDSIKYIGETENRAKFTGKTVMDAGNRFVLPGLWDMHVHFRGGDSLIDENKDLLPLFLAYGITTVRDGGGDITPAVLEWRRKIEKGELDGPGIFTSGPKLDGPVPAWPGSLKISGEEDIKAALDSLQALKADYVKIYDGSLSKENFYGIIKAAEKRGMKVTGHMPLTADIPQAVDLGLDGTEHLYYILKACSPVADSLTQLNIGYGMMDEVLKTYDPQLARQVFGKLGEQQLAVTPTLHIGKTLNEILEVDHSGDSLLQYIGSGIRATYQMRVERARQARARGSEMRDLMQQRSRDVILPIYLAGINISAGSDCGAFNSYVYPGESLHQELQTLADAGLTPQQVLTTAVISGPKFFGLEDAYGSIKAGKVADILILHKNPLEDISNTSKIHAVVKSGRLYDRQRIDQMLQKLKKSD